MIISVLQKNIAVNKEKKEQVMAEEREQAREMLATLGLTAPKIVAVIDIGGVSSVSKMANMREKEVSDLLKMLASLPVARGGVIIGVADVRYLNGFAFWLRDKKRREQDLNELDPNSFSMEECENAIEKMDFEASDTKNAETLKALNPGKIKDGRAWPQWELGFENFLAGQRGKSGVPLIYVIRKLLEVNEDYVFADDTEALIFEAPLVGPTFVADNRMVYSLLKQAALETGSWHWVREVERTQDGRKAMTLLRRHHAGPGEVEKKLALARKQIDEVHYRNEQTYSFDRYSTQLKEAFEVLVECGEGLTAKTMVSTLLKGIQVNHPRVQAAVVVVMSDPEKKSDFSAASSYLSEQIAVTFPGANNRVFNRRVSATTARGHGRTNGRGRGGGRFAGRSGGRNQQNNISQAPDPIPRIVQGIDISDVNRFFQPDEFQRLPTWAKTHIQNTRNPNRRKRNINAINSSNSVTSSISDNRTAAMSANNQVVATPQFGSAAYNNRSA